MMHCQRNYASVAVAEHEVAEFDLDLNKTKQEAQGCTASAQSRVPEVVSLPPLPLYIVLYMQPV